MPAHQAKGCTATLSSLAVEALAQFHTVTRGNAEFIVTLKDTAQQWLRDAIYMAHDGMLPDDWKYSTAREACYAIAHADGYNDLRRVALEFEQDTDVYTADLLRWLSSNVQRPGYCDDIADGRPCWKASITDTIRAGQALERREIFDTILTAIEDEQIEREE